VSTFCRVGSGILYRLELHRELYLNPAGLLACPDLAEQLIVFLGIGDRPLAVQEIIGVNSQKIVEEAVEGLNFAISIEEVKRSFSEYLR
jgi:hypothetical protein